MGGAAGLGHLSICGVSAAIATGGAIRSRPCTVPVLVSSLVVFAVTEVLILPFVAQTGLSHEPRLPAPGLALPLDAPQSPPAASPSS